MRDLLERLGSEAFRQVGRLLAWHSRGWGNTWGSAWQRPYRDLLLLGLGMGVPITWFLIPAESVRTRPRGRLQRNYALLRLVLRRISQRVRRMGGSGCRMGEAFMRPPA